MTPISNRLHPNTGPGQPAAKRRNVGRRRLISPAIAGVFLAAAVGVVLQTASASGAGASASLFHGMLCFGRVYSANKLTLVHASKWETDAWSRYPPQEIHPGVSGVWEAKGEAFRGCHVDVRYEAWGGHHVRLGTLDFTETKRWLGTAGERCISSSPRALHCVAEILKDEKDGVRANWHVS